MLSACLAHQLLVLLLLLLLLPPLPLLRTGEARHVLRSLHCLPELTAKVGVAPAYQQHPGS